MLVAGELEGGVGDFSGWSMTGNLRRGGGLQASGGKGLQGLAAGDHWNYTPCLLS